MTAPSETEQLCLSVLDGDLRSVARAATLIEAQTEAGCELSRRLFSATRNALTIGITGAPGAGKSTLVNGLTVAFRAAQKTVGIIAVDPSSPYSQGALLGDRVRMLEHHDDPGVFIRSTATRGRLGGVAATTMDLALLLDASGRQVVLIETVGVGQGEIDIASVADLTIVVIAPGAGDDIQALKAGILEVADIIVLNKADLPGADRLYHDILECQQLVNSGETRHAILCKTSATAKQGIDTLIDHIDGVSQRRRTPSANAEVWAHRLRQRLRDDLLTGLPPDLLARHARNVSEKIEDPSSAIIALKAEWLETRKNAS